MNLQVPPRLVEKAARRFERDSRRGIQGPSRRPARIITISRQLGSGGRRISETLEAWLHWPLWDREILDLVASESHLHYYPKMFEFLDEKVESGMDAVTYAVLGHANKHVYLHLLPRSVLAIARNDAIILGRGTHLLLPRALKVRVVASERTRVNNLVRYEGQSEEEARKRIRASDKEREAFVRELARRQGRKDPDPDRGAEFDLTINTDKLSIEASARLVLIAARHTFGVMEVEEGEETIGVVA